MPRPPEKQSTSGTESVRNNQCSVTENIYILEEEEGSTWSKANTKPPGEGHDRVVVDVKKRHLAVLLSQHKENLKRKKKKRGHVFRKQKTLET